jgi:hypothetical protein
MPLASGTIKHENNSVAAGLAPAQGDWQVAATAFKGLFS